MTAYSPPEKRVIARRLRAEGAASEKDVRCLD